jgi:FHA domain
MARYSFDITDGPDQGRTFDLEAGITLIGRRDTPAEDDPEGSRRWVLTDPAVSRTHARIDWDGSGRPVLVHLSSTNATLLEGRIVTGQSMQDGQSLEDGNKLRMGQTGLTVKAALDNRWCVVECFKESQHELISGQPWEVDGIRITCEGPKAEVSVLSAEAEAYLLRSIDNQFWTTTIQPGRPLPLRNSDVIRTEELKFVIHDRVTD